MLLKRSVALAVLLLVAAPALAQTTPDPAAGRTGRGNRPDPQQMRQQRDERMKQSLGLSDEDWKALQPKIQKVQELQRAASSGRGGFGAARQGRRGGQNRTPAQPADSQPPAPSPIQEKARALQTLLDNKDSKPEEIKAALGALRDERVQARENLKKGQEELRQLVTARQESVLVMLGILE